VGGDYYGIRQLDREHYGFLLADVMGHGLAAALYTMHRNRSRPGAVGLRN